MNEIDKSSFMSWIRSHPRPSPGKVSDGKIPGSLCKEYPWCGLIWQYELELLSSNALPLSKELFSKYSVRIPDRKVLWKNIHKEATSAMEELSPKELAVPAETEASEESRISPGTESGEKESKITGLLSNQLIESFLEKAPKIIPTDHTDFVADLTLSNREEDNMVTETLAEIYTRQGHREKAIAIYKKLILKFPEKSAYFADRINSL